MKVKELIETLKKFDGEIDVRFRCCEYDCDVWRDVLTMEPQKHQIDGKKYLLIHGKDE